MKGLSSVGPLESQPSVLLLCLTADAPAPAHAGDVSMPCKLEVTNNTSKSVKIKLEVDDGSGSGEATIASGGSYTFSFNNTLWYAKKVKHRNKIYLWYNGQLAKTYEYKIYNELTVIGQWLLPRNKIIQTSSPMECSVTLSTDTPIKYDEPVGYMTVNSCNE